MIFVMVCCASCSPDEMDAFARGYRYGYENSELIKVSDGANPSMDGANIKPNLIEVENNLKEETL